MSSFERLSTDKEKKHRQATVFRTWATFSVCTNRSLYDAFLFSRGKGFLVVPAFFWQSQITRTHLPNDVVVEKSDDNGDKFKDHQVRESQTAFEGYDWVHVYLSRLCPVFSQWQIFQLGKREYL
ncbi:hypothetical protein MMC24_002661 [Lignoscripta atroalba]|nr:hypothetical protein [Lignoscripta atroalba]